MMWSALIAIGINVLTIFVFPKHYTLGLKVTRLSICELYGGIPSIKKIIVRQIMMAFYWIPFLNLMLILTNMFAVIIYKDKYIHDFLTKTQITNINSVLLKDK